MNNTINNPKAGGLLLRLVLLCACFSFVIGCSPKIIEHISTKVEYRDREVRDSIYLRDSIWMKEYVKGDTIYLNKYVYKYIYKDKFQIDTLIREVHDTTAVQVPVEKELTFAQKAKINSFWWLLLTVIGLLVWIFRKPIMKLFI